MANHGRGCRGNTEPWSHSSGDCLEYQRGGPLFLLLLLPGGRSALRNLVVSVGLGWAGNTQNMC